MTNKTNTTKTTTSRNLSAAAVARKNSIDARKFRAFLRSIGLNSRRGFADAKAANAAVRRFRKETDAPKPKAADTK